MIAVVGVTASVTLTHGVVTDARIAVTALAPTIRRVAGGEAALVGSAGDELEVVPGASLLSVVRDQIGLTGSKEGCDDSECGACMMLLDGKPVNACAYLALQAEGRAVTTVEGLSDEDNLSALQRALLEHGGVQCGFCTPGMLVSATALLARSPDPNEDEVRIALAGNLCRYTGYTGIAAARATPGSCAP